MSSSLKADLCLVVVTFLAAISWIFSREAVLQMPPLLFMGVRFFSAGLMLALFAGRQFLQLSSAQRVQAIRVGLCFAVSMSLWVMGITHGTHVGEGAFLTITGVLLVPVVTRLFFAERPPLSTWLAIPVAVIGLALLALKDGFRPELGQLFYVTAAVGFAVFYVLNTRAANHESPTVSARFPLKKIPPLVLTAWVLTTVGIFSFAVSWILEPWQPTAALFSAEQASYWPAFELSLWVIASALLGTAARFLLQTYAQSLSPQSNGVIILIIEPIWVTLLAAAWFGERMSGIQALGCGFIFAALIVNRWHFIQGVLKRVLT